MNTFAIYQEFTLWLRKKRPRIDLLRLIFGADYDDLPRCIIFQEFTSSWSSRGASSSSRGASSSSRGLTAGSMNLALSIKSFLLAICLACSSQAIAQQQRLAEPNNPRVAKLVENITAPSYLNVDYFNVVFDYIYKQIKPAQQAIVMCLSQQQHSQACANHQLKLDPDVRFISSIKIDNYRLVVRFKANKDLGVQEGRTLIFIPTGTSKGIYWKVTGSIFNLLPTKPNKEVNYYCPKPEELQVFFDGKKHLVDEQNLSWQVNNANRLPGLRGKTVEFLMASTSPRTQRIFCAYTDYLILTTFSDTLKVLPSSGQWDKANAGRCRPLDQQVTQCPFKIVE